MKNNKKTPVKHRLSIYDIQTAILEVSDFLNLLQIQIEALRKDKNIPYGVPYYLTLQELTAAGIIISDMPQLYNKENQFINTKNNY